MLLHIAASVFQNVRLTVCFTQSDLQLWSILTDTEDSSAYFGVVVYKLMPSRLHCRIFYSVTTIMSVSCHFGSVSTAFALITSVPYSSNPVVIVIRAWSRAHTWEWEREWVMKTSSEFVKFFSLRLSNKFWRKKIITSCRSRVVASWRLTARQQLSIL